MQYKVMIVTVFLLLMLATGCAPVLKQFTVRQDGKIYRCYSSEYLFQPSRDITDCIEVKE